MRRCPWSLASSIPVLGLEKVCPRKGCPWLWPQIFFVSSALASSLVSSTPPLIITNEVPVTILKALISLPRRIRKGVLIRRIIASHLCTAVGCRQLRKKTRILFEHYYSHFHHYLLLGRYVMFENSILSKPKGGGRHKQPFGGARPALKLQGDASPHRELASPHRDSASPHRDFSVPTTRFQRCLHCE